ncbi:TPA: hypothetical protein ACX3IQ_004476 [Vibrio parahaemolyticus]
MPHSHSHQAHLSQFEVNPSANILALVKCKHGSLYIEKAAKPSLIKMKTSE